MAVEFVSTVGTTDYSFDWITEEITIENGVNEVSADDLKTAIHDAQDGTQGIYRSQIGAFGNPVVLTTTSSTFLNVILQGGWKINSFAIVGTLTVGDGNVVSLADGIDIFGPNVLVNFVNNTSAAGVLVTGGGSGLSAEESLQLAEVYKLLGLDITDAVTITPTGIDSDSGDIDVNFSGDGVTSTRQERQ
jgi:hypothetical protein